MCRKVSLYRTVVIGGVVGAVIVVAASVRGVGRPLEAIPESPAAMFFTGPSEERDSIIADEARRFGMLPELAIAISHAENWSGDSTATHPRSGAVGLMQVMPSLWGDAFFAECGDQPLTWRRRNACVGVNVALGYFQKCGDWDCGLRLYVGAVCAPRDTPERCARKERAGTEYVRLVVKRLDRTDLSPARDEMALSFGRRQ